MGGTIDDLVVVIMAGGAGTRFWPLSTPELPKQFMTAFGDASFFQQAVARAETLVSPDKILVVTNRSFIGMVRSQAPQIPAEQMVGEPMRRDTAPAVALSAVLVNERWPGCVCVVMPADHVIRDHAEFQRTLTAAVARARTGGLGTLGIKPTYAATSYGYLHFEPADDGSRNPRVRKLRGFVEKPDRARAEAFVASDDYFWNSGLFIWKTETVLDAIERFLPNVHKAMMPLAGQLGASDLPDRLHNAFDTVETLSIDCGIMEKAKDVWAVEASFDWSDVGGWLAALDLVEADESGNRIRGDVIVDRSANNLLLSEDPGKPMVCVGVEGLIVATTPEGTLICAQEKAEGIKPQVHQILDPARRSAREDHRPWGYYEVLSDLGDHKVKRIVVDPGQRLSLQRHQHRSEHWHVVAGEAMVTREEEEILVSAGESIDIPQGAWHRVRNPGTEPLVFIEVQRGTYFGEDDIERRQDDYGRMAANE